MISEQEALWHCTPKAQWQGPPGLWVLSDVRQLPNHSGPRFPFRKTISLLIPTPECGWMMGRGNVSCKLQSTAQTLQASALAYRYRGGGGGAAQSPPPPPQAKTTESLVV